MHRRTLAPLNLGKIERDELIKSPTKQKMSTSVLPDAIRSIFPYEYFNAVQSECFHLAFETNENLVVSAPTGTGKTVVAELAIAHVFLEMFNNQQDLTFQKADKKNVKKTPLVVYVSPLKSLCQERASVWSRRFKEIPEFSDIDIIELTSDTQGAFPRKVKNPTIICTTPEKLDLATRSMKGSKEEESFSLKPKTLLKKSHKYNESFDQLSLVIFDEVHNMSDARGAVLEAVMSRILFISQGQNNFFSAEIDTTQLESTQNESNILPINENKIRVIALSATIRNYEDFKQWLKVKHNTIFDDTYRSTKIDTRIFGYSMSSSRRSNDWMFESSLTPKVTPIIRQYSKNKPVLIFCCTRKSCEKTAMKLANDFSPTQQEQAKIQNTDEMIFLTSNIRDKTLLLTLKSKVGFHSAGLCQSDRTLVEQLFMKGQILYLCTTSTLSQGVNLPAYLVIIKGTKHFTDSSLEEYDSTQILQMQGRAGRPQFEKEGMCIIMTEKENVKKYEKMINQSDPIESSLLDNLEEHLNAEIALGFINNEEDVLRWLMSTFLYIRMQKNPYHYKLNNASNVTNFLTKLSIKHLKELEKHNFITYEKKQDDKKIFSQDVGLLCSQYGLLIGTMILYNESRPPKTMENALSLLCKSFEFNNDIIVRQDEKQKLRLMSVQPKLRFLSDPSFIDDDPEKEQKSSIFGNNNYTAEAKVFVLIDTALSLGKIDDWSLSQEFNRIKRTSERLVACMLRLMISQNKRSLLGAVNCAVLLKCIKRQMWENDSERLAQQVKGIGEVYAKKISNGFNSLKKQQGSGRNSSSDMTMNDFRKMTSYQIDKLTNHRTGWGIQIVDEIQKIPEYSLSFKIQQSPKNCEILINLTNLSQSDPINPYHKADIFVGIKKKDLLIDYFHIKKVVGYINKTFSVFLENQDEIDISQISVYVIDSEYIGIDLCQNIVLDGENQIADFVTQEVSDNDEYNEDNDNNCDEIYEKSPYFKSNNSFSSNFELKKAPKKKSKPQTETFLTQYFQLEKKPIEVNKQRVMAICPEVFDDQFYDDKSSKDCDYEIVWPKPQKSSFSLTEKSLQPEKEPETIQDRPNDNDSDDDDKEVVLWSYNKSLKNLGSANKKVEFVNETSESSNTKNEKIKEAESEEVKTEDFKLDDDFWECLEFDEGSN